MKERPQDREREVITVQSDSELARQLGRFAAFKHERDEVRRAEVRLVFWREALTSTEHGLPETILPPEGNVFKVVVQPGTQYGNVMYDARAPHGSADARPDWRVEVADEGGIVFMASKLSYTRAHVLAVSEDGLHALQLPMYTDVGIPAFAGCELTVEPVTIPVQD